MALGGKIIIAIFVGFIICYYLPSLFETDDELNESLPVVRTYRIFDWIITARKVENKDDE